MNTPKGGDPSKWLILRQVVLYTQENVAAGIGMAAEALKHLERVYMEGGKTLFLHVPPEDMPFQQKVGGTRDSPVLVELVTAEGIPVCAFPLRELPCLSYLNGNCSPILGRPLIC